MTRDPMERIAAALERLAPAPASAPDFEAARAFVWHADPDRLDPVARVNRVALDLLQGIDRARDTLMANTARYYDPALGTEAALSIGKARSTTRNAARRPA